jgi:hypothetical protein
MASCIVALVALFLTLMEGEEEGPFDHLWSPAEGVTCRDVTRTPTSFGSLHFNGCARWLGN